MWDKTVSASVDNYFKIAMTNEFFFFNSNSARNTNAVYNKCVDRAIFIFDRITPYRRNRLSIMGEKDLVSVWKRMPHQVGPWTRLRVVGENNTIDMFLDEKEDDDGTPKS